MRILVTMHHPEEGPGTLGAFLSAQGAKLETVHLYKGDHLPSGDFRAVVSMGGPMNVYEELMHPWLAEETAYLAKAARAGTPVIGICLGAQLLAKALGAAVVDSPASEHGWRSLALTDEGLKDPLFKRVAPNYDVFQWHGDMFNIPSGGRLLAKGDKCPHQAFAYQNAYGFQFHVEVTPQIVETWYETPEQKEDIEPGWATSGKEMTAQGMIIYQNFWNLIVDRS